jgi:YD repeat-containing protein
LRRPTVTTFPDNNSTARAWNQRDQLTQVTDPKGVQTSYQTNAFGEVVSETSPDIGTIQYTRDANGDVTTIKDANGQISRIERDALGRPTLIEYAQGHSASFSYDAAGHVTRIDDKSGSTRYERDTHSRILGRIKLVNDNPSSPMQLVDSFGYQGGDLASMGYASGLKVFYRRSAGRITGIDVQEPASHGKTPAVIPFVSDLTHTALGQPKSWRWVNGDTASRSFDTDGRMTQSEIASYSYDAASRITGITQSLWAQRTVTTVVNGKTQTVTELYQAPISWTAGYDSRNRLTSFARAGAETRYGYDANSNRLTAIDTTSSEIDLEGAFDQPNFTQSASQILTIDAASNRLLGFTQTLTKTQAGKPLSSVTSNVNYSIDANGAMTSDGLRTFEYDEARRLAKVKIVKDGEAATVEYLHNALGQRVFKSPDSSGMTGIHIGVPRLIQLAMFATLQKISIPGRTDDLESRQGCNSSALFPHSYEPSVRELRDREVAHQLFGFGDIHALLRDRQPRKVLRRLLTPDGALRAGFENKNHAWYCAGCAHFDLGNYADALSAFRKALSANLGDVQCLLAIGNCYEAEGRPNLAELAFRSGLAMMRIAQPPPIHRLSAGPAG